jgi:hypothetical protein
MCVKSILPNFAQGAVIEPAANCVVKISPKFVIVRTQLKKF